MFALNPLTQWFPKLHRLVIPSPLFNNIVSFVEMILYITFCEVLKPELCLSRCGVVGDLAKFLFKMSFLTFPTWVMRTL